MLNFSDFHFVPPMNYPGPEDLKVFDFTKGYDADYIRSFDWGIGKYNEKRQKMYTADQFGGERNIHMGIDIWTEAGSPVFSIWRGEVCYTGDNDQDGDYGPTLILKYEVGSQSFYALYGHLARTVLQRISRGDKIQKGQQIAAIGTVRENGGWAPHLHFQLALEDPGKADMPGVVAEEDRREALKKYPDPRHILGPLY